MLVPFFTITFLSLALSASASPARRTTTFCEQLVVSCAAAGPQSITNPWTIPACIFGATCFGGSSPVDAFLIAVATERGDPSSAHASLSLPVLTVETFNNISTDRVVITQQNFIDGVYSALDASNGPYPDVSSVISSFQSISVWTQFCSNRGIPWKNFADYFKYSATVDSPGCTSPAYPVVTNEPSCQKIFEECLRTVNFNLYNIWTVKPCVFAAVCFPGDINVDKMLTAVYVYRTGNDPSTAPKSSDQPSLSQAQFASISTNGNTVTTQNWIDGYYELLSGAGGPFPTSADIVVEYFRRVRNWTGFCGLDGVRYQAFAYYFNWSSTNSYPVICP
ncbi:hypothetical protein JR316_0013265 [Psilocybe cubensis]|uniref:Uncharacterized protein n=2 Tax=Psilocybe cubensis TaxID=181762 RepID=A0A8H7XRW6_PSICU|nr:hypothetical protein JR316_0013265 [Psilocybe cubensis]KAH9474800.1 hypothetical protein JR316_0013265 [Psilocybe cubensis]